MQSGNHKTHIRKYNYVDSLSCYEKIKQDIINQTQTTTKTSFLKIYLKKNVGCWQSGDRLFLDVCVSLSVSLLFASIVLCRRAHI